MANRFARKTGNWNASDVWSDTPTGTAGAQFIPVAGDVVMANSFTITINVDATCLEVRTDTTGGATAGGSFTLSNTVTLTADVLAGGVAIAVNFSASIGYIVGNITGGSGAGYNHGCFNSSSGILNIVGNVTSGSGGNCYGAYNTTGTTNITGNVTATIGYGVYNSTGTINITGNVIGGSGATIYGVQNISTGIINITGNVIGGSGANSYGVSNASTGIVNITGNAIGGIGSFAYGANNGSTGVMIVGCAVGNDHGLGYSTNNGTPGVFGYGINTGTQQATTKVKAIKYGAKGQSPTAGLVLLDTADLANSYIEFAEAGTFKRKRLVTAENLGAIPAVNDVREGVTYNFGNNIGTMKVPNPVSVSYGVPVDNTLGTAVIDFDSITKAIKPALMNV
jgi:hypothetical protein